MKLLTKEQKIELLKKLSRESSDIKAFDFDNTIFRAWRCNAERTFERVFGKESEEMQHYKRLFYSDEGMLITEGPEAVAAIWKMGFDSLLAMIPSLIDDIAICDDTDKKEIGSKKKLQVFISSTYKDLKEERQAAVEAILQAGHIPAGMELFKAGKKQMETIKQWIDDSDVYLLILGGRYGSIDEETGKSYTELEYRYAIEEKGKPGFAIVLSDEMIKRKDKWTFKHQFFNTKNQLPYNDFKKYVMSNLITPANTIDGIKAAILLNMSQYVNDSTLVGWIRSDAIQEPQKIDTEIQEQIDSLKEEVKKSTLVRNALGEEDEEEKV
ncbi:hypothetical protein FACS1894110_14460 [Spirochaetia bacterium]|nr:hypothetical protein FACS1894110_14460 [Spirochaetia bacterium]